MLILDSEKVLGIVEKNIEKLAVLNADVDKFLIVASAGNGSQLVVDNSALQKAVVKASGFFEKVRSVDRVFLLSKSHKSDKCRVFLICNRDPEGIKAPLCISCNTGSKPLGNVFLVAENVVEDCFESVVATEELGTNATTSLASAHPRNAGRFLIVLVNFYLNLLGIPVNGQGALLESEFRGMILGDENSEFGQYLDVK